MNLFSNQRNPKQSRFSLPNDSWKGELKPQAFAILAYLRYLHIHCKKDVPPSADEIAAQLHMSKDMAAEWIAELNHRGLLDSNMVPITVMKHITKLAEKQLIMVENTSCVGRHGMKWNGNNLYTVLPIQSVMDHCYQQQLLRLEA